MGEIRSKDNFVMRFYAAVTPIHDSQKLKEKPSGKVMGGLLNSKKGGNKFVDHEINLIILLMIFSGLYSLRKVDLQLLQHMKVSEVPPQRPLLKQTTNRRQYQGALLLLCFV